MFLNKNCYNVAQSLHTAATSWFDIITCVVTNYCFSCVLLSSYLCFIAWVWVMLVNHIISATKVYNCATFVFATVAMCLAGGGGGSTPPSTIPRSSCKQKAIAVWWLKCCVLQAFLWRCTPETTTCQGKSIHVIDVLKRRVILLLSQCR